MKKWIVLLAAGILAISIIGCKKEEETPAEPGTTATTGATGTTAGGATAGGTTTGGATAGTTGG